MATTTAAFTTRTLFDDLFNRFIPAGAQLLLDDDDDGDNNGGNQDASAEAAPAAATSLSTSQVAGGDATLEGGESPVGSPQSVPPIAIGGHALQREDDNDEDGEGEGVLSLDLDDEAVLEATALGTDESEYHHYVHTAMAQKQQRSSSSHDSITTSNNNGVTAAAAQHAEGSSSVRVGGAAAGGGGGVASAGAPHLSAEEQLDRMPIDGDEVFTGVCVLFNHGKGFGFISPDIGGPDVYFTREGIALSFSRLMDGWVTTTILQDLRPLLVGPAGGDSGTLTHEVLSKRVDGIEQGLRLVQLGRAFLVGGERVSFRVTSNSSSGGGGGGAAAGGGAGQRRKLRAVEICSASVECGPIMLERVLLGLVGSGSIVSQLFGVELPPVVAAAAAPLVVVVGAEGEATAPTPLPTPHTRRFCDVSLPPMTLYPTPAGNTPTELVEPLTSARFPGWVKSIAGGDKGYLRPDSRAMPPLVDTTSVCGSQDAVLFMDVIVWDAATDRSQRVLDEGVLVEYSIVGFDRNKKPLAAVVTGRGGVPLNPATWDLTEVAKQKRAELLAAGGGPSSGGGGSSHGNGNVHGTGYKRMREDAGDLLLLEDDADGGGYL